jgi:hypothetical protein
MTKATLTPELLVSMDAYWRAANYLSACQIYLHDNPLLKRPLAARTAGNPELEVEHAQMNAPELIDTACSRGCAPWRVPSRHGREPHREFLKQSNSL